MAKQPLDLYKLYKTVVSLGGLTEVHSFYVFAALSLALVIILNHKHMQTIMLKHCER